ncbi:S8 family peptidase [Bowmanella denitrificans]|uniref:S8 family peptidase n=1 Tax=Bowmanella denitrificans TaxID=366582 RepID=UPI000C9B271F|nr:S8 family serine peptidase [Bowmanella denitrificans]
MKDTAAENDRNDDEIKIEMNLYLAFLISLVFPFAATANEVVHFNNFFQRYEAVGQSGVYQLKAGEVEFRISNRVVIKALPSLSQSEIARLDRNVVSITELYLAKDFNYLMIELTSPEHLTQIIDLLELHPKVLLAQPDILQLNRLSGLDRDIRRNETMVSEQIGVSVENTSMPQHAEPDLHILPEREAVRVAIIDDGFDLTHPEFTSTKVAFQYDTETRTLDASPKLPQDSHGTRIAGILFADRNGNEVEGLIPGATLIAIRQPNTWTSQTLLAFQVARLAGADVINCSWHSEWLLEPVRDVVHDLATSGREGKGIAVVFAAGNDGIVLAPNLHEASIEEAIVIGAKTKSGVKARYSNWGESVDGYLDGSSYLSTANKGGFSKINGTSLAAARASGVIAELLATHPEMTLVDIERHIRNY